MAWSVKGKNVETSCGNPNESSDVPVILLQDISNAVDLCSKNSVAIESIANVKNDKQPVWSTVIFPLFEKQKLGVTLYSALHPTIEEKLPDDQNLSGARREITHKSAAPLNCAGMETLLHAMCCTVCTEIHAETFRVD